MLVMLFSLLPAAVLLEFVTGYWPYGLPLLTWVVRGCAALLLVAGLRDSIPAQAILLSILIVFNPLFPFHLSPATFGEFAMAASLGFVAAGFLFLRHSSLLRKLLESERCASCFLQ